MILTGLPGVLFVLPDSYVDAENKDYGGKHTSFFRVFLDVFELSLGCIVMCWLNIFLTRLLSLPGCIRSVIFCY